MRLLIRKLFINNWPRKSLSVILAIIIWLGVNKSLITSKTINNVAVKIMNIPPGKTIEGIQSNGILSQRVNLTIIGNKTLLRDLNANDIEVVLDVLNKDGEWISSITKNDLRSTNPEINISQGINKVLETNILIKLTKLITEKIPITITKPIGEAPQGYHYVDIWPYQLYITVSGSEGTINKLKLQGINLTFNLNDIAKSQLDDIRSTTIGTQSDVVSFFVPSHWKQISLPVLSAAPIEINDPDAKFLRIDFIRNELLKIENPIPIELYFPPSKINGVSPQKISITPNYLIENRNGLKMITTPLYVKGVSSFFLELMKDMIQIVVIVPPKKDGACMNWSIQFINHKFLEDRYVTLLTTDVT